MKDVKYSLLSVIVSSILIVSGCSNSDSDSSSKEVDVQEDTPKELVNPLTGIFVDSAVQGLRYKCSSGTGGVTNALGEFICEAGDTVAFFLGDISLGEVAAQEIITPSSLFPENEEAALNFAQLIQTLDSDDDPSNGIGVNEELLTKLGDVDFTSPNFDEEMQEVLGNDIVLVSNEEALKHLKETFVALDIAANGIFASEEEPEEESAADPVTTPPSSTTNQAPVIISPADVDAIENNTTAITIVATDNENDTLIFSISGTDATSFDINSSSGIVVFKVAPDYETKRTYIFTATATDTSSNTDALDVNISILDVAEPIVHNGKNYLTVISPFGTNRVWLDRNLGASQACTALDDVACFGDLYQWGRNYDGHQVRNSDTNSTLESNVTNDYVDNRKFIDNNHTDPYDWADVDGDGAIRAANWSKTDGTSVCPIGFRVPTKAELEIEDDNTTDNITAFENFLKLPTDGLRDYNAAITEVNTVGNIWVVDVDNFSSYVFSYLSGMAATHRDARAVGYSVRCIKD